MTEPRRRPAFTLLEVVLAVAMSTILLAALYVSLNSYYSQTRTGRALLDQASVVRTVGDSIMQDISGELPPINQALPQNALVSSTTTSSGSSGTSSSSSGSSTGTTSSTSTSTGSSSSSTGTSSSSSSSSSTSPGTTVVFNLQVYGDEQNLVVTGQGVSKDLVQAPQSAPNLTGDLRQVTYWVIPGKGLARQEVRQATGPSAGVYPPAMPPDVGDGAAVILAPEVKALKLEYYDGTTWQTSWDGSQLDATTSLPLGPPAAIALTLTMEVAGARGQTRDVTIRQVVAIPAANNFALSQTQTSTP